MPPREDDWSGPRPLALGTPVVVVALLAAVLAAVLVLAVRRDVEIPAEVAAHYVDLMAGALPLQIESADPQAVAEALGGRGLGFVPRVRDLEPEFALVGGGVHELADRPAAYWYYRDRRSEMILAEAFTGTVAEAGRAADIRDEPPVTLHVFRKTTQTIAFWQTGPEVYVMTATLPGERSIALAGRLAAGSEVR